MTAAVVLVHNLTPFFRDSYAFWQGGGGDLGGIIRKTRGFNRVEVARVARVADVESEIRRIARRKEFC